MQFLANMSHELRTPINAIIGFTEMLREDAEALKQDCRAAGSRAWRGPHLLALINDILDLSKIEAGRMELNLDTFALPPLIDEVVKTIEPLAARTATSRSSLRHRDRDLACGPMRLRLGALLNLKAVTWTHRGGPRARTSVAAVSAAPPGSTKRNKRQSKGRAPL